jgi:hypothetical protein
MKLPRTWTLAISAILACLMAGCGSSGSSAKSLAGQASSQCSLGTPLGVERQLLGPRPGTFYSVDVLNPDVVFFHGRYLMYFSGNDRHTEEGNWREGFAIATSPTGPFRIQQNLEGNYLNGGTTAWQGHLWHVVENNPIYGSDIRSEIASSSDGIHWRHESFLPGFTDSGVTYHGADFWLEPQGSHLDVYMLLVPPQGGIRRSLGVAAYAAGHWSDFHIILPIRAVASMPWASADLGEPATFSVAGNHYLLFVGLAEPSLIRSVGLAQETTTGWSVCGALPALPNGVRWGPASSIDPSPLVVGDRLYLYYGATRTNGFGANLGGSVGVRVFAAR